MNLKSIEYYKKTDEKSPYKDWYCSLDKSARAKIDVRLKRAEAGNYGNHRNLSEGINELKFAEGIRIYFAEVDNKIILLLLCSKKEIRKQKFFSKAQCVSRERFLGKSGFAGFPKNKLVSLYQAETRPGKISI